MSKIEIKPQPGPQEAFLSSSADIVIYGGAAGGGKTWALLFEPLRHYQNKAFGAVIFRRTYPEITNEGALWDESVNLYSLLGARPVKGDLYWDFGGAKISFAHLQYDDTVETWKTSQIALIEFDQLETFTAYQFWYMFSRNRSLCGVKPYVRATANPEPGWLADLLDWWIGEDGYARLDRTGVIRWFIRGDNDELIWADNKKELQEKYSKDPKSMTFLLATIYDNKILMEKNPEYLANLQALPLVERERLLGDAKRGGNWKIKPSAGKVFNRSWFKIVEAVPAEGVVVRRWDFAATEKELVKDDPDYTASCLMLAVNGSYYILDATAERISPAELDRTYENITRQDQVRFTGQSRRYLSRWEQEPGSAGKRESWRMTKQMAGIDAKGLPSAGDKLVRAKPLAAQAEIGNVYLLAGPWNERWLNHMHGQPDLPHDDEMDAASGAFGDLTHQAGRQKAVSRQG